MYLMIVVFLIVYAIYFFSGGGGTGGLPGGGGGGGGNLSQGPVSLEDSFPVRVGSQYDNWKSKTTVGGEEKFMQVAAFVFWYKSGTIDENEWKDWGVLFNEIRVDCITNWNFKDPPNMRDLNCCVNIYLTNDISPNVGTETIDNVKTPCMFMAFGLDDTTNTRSLILHEAFHIFQWCGTNCGGLRGFSYEDNHKWYTETLANLYVALNNDDYDQHEVAGILANPHLNMWQSFDNLKGINDPTAGESWLYGVRQYSSAIPYYFIVSKGIERHIFSEGHYNLTKLSPQVYLYANIPNFEESYADFGASLIHCAWLPKNKTYYEEIIAEYARNEGPQHVHQYVCEFDLADGLESVELNPKVSGINYLHTPHNFQSGFFYPSPYIATRAWGFNIYKIRHSTQATIQIELDTDILEDYRIRIVDDQGSVIGSYDNLVETNSTQITNGYTYIVIACVTKVFSGYDAFEYGIRINTL